MNKLGQHVLILLLASTPIAGLNAGDASSPSGENCRRIHFKTSEVTYPNLDISPDGKLILFDLLGDLYVLPVAGGEATRLTEGLAWDSRPVWSPDGRSIAFISDREGRPEAFVAEVSGGGKSLGNPRQISRSSEGPEYHDNSGLLAVEWMPSSSEVVFNGKRLSTKSFTQKTNGLADGFHALSYYGSGEAMYYAPVSLSTELVRSHEILRATGDPSDGDKPVAKLTAALGYGFEPTAVSRDGRWFVNREVLSKAEQASLEPYSTAVGTPQAPDSTILESVITVFDRVRLERRVIVAPSISPGWRNKGDLGRLGLGANVRFAITPDSKYVLIPYAGKIHRIELSSGDSKAISISADVDQCLDPIVRNNVRLKDGEHRIANIRNSAMSPASGKIVFSALRRLYVMNRENGLVERFGPQEHGQFMPSYSPDGSWIAYVTWDSVEGGHVWRVSADGGTVHRVTTEPGYYQAPAWSPDGRRIAFLGSQDISTKRVGFNTSRFGGDIYVHSVEEQRTTTLRKDALFGGGLSFTEGGKRIAFLSYIGPGQKRQLPLYASVRLDGSDPQPVVPDQFLERAARTPFASIDESGKHAAIVKFGNVYLVNCKGPLSHSTDKNQVGCKEEKLTEEGGYDPRWINDGRTLEWSFADRYFQANASDLVRAADLAGSKSLESWLRDAGLLKQWRISLNVRKNNSDRTLVLRNARIVTMRENEVIEAGTIVIRGGRIENIGRLENVSIPVDATVIDVKGKTIIPGLIDAHAHIDIPRELLDQNYWGLLASLAFGITTARDPSNGGDHGFAYSELIESGITVGPRLFGATSAIPQNIGVLNSQEDASRAARRVKALGATFMKYHHNQDRKQRRWLVEAARENGLNFAAHYPLAEPGVLTMISDGATTAEHEVLVQTDYFSDVLTFMLQSGTSLDDSRLANERAMYPCIYWPEIAHREEMVRFYRGAVPSTHCPTDRILAVDNELVPLRPAAVTDAASFAKIAEKGDQIMMGSHGDHIGIGMHFEMWAHARGGMTNHQVLAAATINGAKGAGLQLDLGSLEVGKVADLLVLDGNPLDDIRNTLSLAYVMKDGVLRSSKTLDEVWPSITMLPLWEHSGESSTGVH